MSDREPLSAGQIAEALNELPGWEAKDNKLQRTFEWAHFRQAFAFMTQCAFWCEKLNHHPEWSNVWNKVEIAICTHDSGNVITEKDVQLAAKISVVAQGFR